MNFRLYRSRDRIVAGVAGGLADALDLDPSLVRIVWALAMFAGFPILIYIVMAIVVPEEPDDWAPWQGADSGTTTRTTPAGVIPATPEPVPGETATTSVADESAAAGATTSAWQATTDTSSVPVSPAPGHDSWRDTRWAERQARREQRWAERRERHSYRRDGSGAIVFGVILILIGAGFLAHQLIPSLDWDQIWPVGLVVVGVLFLVGAVVRRPAE